MDIYLRNFHLENLLVGCTGYVNGLKTLFRNADIRSKLYNRRFSTKKTDCVEHIIFPRRPEIASHTTNPISWLHPPTNLTEHCSYPELCSDFWRFGPNFACMVAPLNANLQRDQPKTFWPLDDEELMFTILLKVAFISPTVLAPPKYIEHITPGTDTRDVQTGNVL